MNDWTPCSERLPDKEGEYIVTDDAGGMATVTTDEFEHYANGEPMWLFGQHITAWMPFPEPYKEEKMKPKKLYISIDSYATEKGEFYDGNATEKGEFYDGNAYIDFSIGNRSYRVPLYFDIEKNPHILDIEKHDQAIKNELLTDLDRLAKADTKILAFLFGKFGIRGVLQDCSNEEILSGINEFNKFTSRKNRLKDLLEQNDFSIEEAKQLLED